MEENRKCLICCNNTAAHSSQKSTGKLVLDSHLEVIFLLRKVLEVPVFLLSNFLEGCPNVEGWINVCSPCAGLVKECKLIYEQLVEVTRKWTDCKRRVVQIIKETSGDEEEDNGGSDHFQNLFLDICQNTRSFVQNHPYESLKDSVIAEDPEDQEFQNLVSIRAVVKQEQPDVKPSFDNQLISFPSPTQDCEDNDDNFQPNHESDISSSDNDSDRRRPGSSKTLAKPNKRPPPKKKAGLRSVPSKTFNCHVCNMKLRNSIRLKEHLYSKHCIGTLSFQCSKCHKMFAQRHKLERHKIACSRSLASDEKTRSRSDEWYMPPGNNFRIKCPVPGCPLTWPIVSLYRVHYKTEHTEEERAALPKVPKIMECLTCGKLFAVKALATAHAYRHDKTLKREKICEVCGLAFATNANLLVHKRVSMVCKRLQGLSESEATVMCDICGNRFSTRSRLGKHVREKHEGIFKHQCEHCGKGFSSKAYWAAHRAKFHQVEVKEFELHCPVEGCGRTFFRKNLLTEHLHQSHSQGEPEFKCEHCGKGFRVKRCLAQHVNVVHSAHRKN